MWLWRRMPARRLLGTSSYPPFSIVRLPSLSPTMETGTVSSWKVSRGSTYEEGDVIAEIETDKAVVDFEAQDPGIVAKLLVEEGNVCNVGTPIMVLAEDSKDVDKFDDFAYSDGGEAPASEEEEAAAPAAQEEGAVSVPKSAPFLLPGARFLAESKKIDVSSLKGTAKGGRITKGDILLALSAGKSFPPLSPKQQPAQAASSSPPPEPSKTTAPKKTAAAAETTTNAASSSAAGSYDSGFPKPRTLSPLVFTSPTTTGAPFEDTPASGMRKVISKRLTESRSTVPHSYASISVELDEIAKLRKQLAQEFDVKVSVNDFVIRACALALRDVPKANSSWVNGNATPNQSVDVSVAVATPTGLITPIVKQAQSKGLSQISAEVRDLAGRARLGKLAPEEYQGGTFSVSNLGMFGIKEFSAVINPPQACILAVGGGIKTLKPGPKTVTCMTSRLSHDRRVVDEPIAAHFLQAYAYYIANPKLLVL